MDTSNLFSLFSNGGNAPSSFPLMPMPMPDIDASMGGGMGAISQAGGPMSLIGLLKGLMAGANAGDAQAQGSSPLNDPEAPGLVPSAPERSRVAPRVPGAAEASQSRGQAGPPSMSVYQQDGDNSPHMLLRRLLTGSNEPPVAGPLPDLKPLISRGSGGAQGDAAPPQGTVLGSMSGAEDAAPFTNPFAAPGSAPAVVSSPAPRDPRAQPGPVSPPPGPAPQTSSWQTVANPQSQPGLMDLIKGDRSTPKFLIDLLTGAMAGAATATGPRAGNVAAAGQGYMNAMNVFDKRKQQEALAAKSAFDQNLALRKDGRAESELGLKRDDGVRRDAEYGLKARDQDRKESETRVKNQVSVEKLMKIRDDGSLPLAAKIKIQDQLNQYADKINKNGTMQQPELDAALTKERSRLEQYYGLQKPAAAAPVTRQARGPDGKVVTLELKDGQWVAQ